MCHVTNWPPAHTVSHTAEEGYTDRTRGLNIWSSESQDILGKRIARSNFGAFQNCFPILHLQKKAGQINRVDCSLLCKQRPWWKQELQLLQFPDSWYWSSFPHWAAIHPSRGLVELFEDEPDKPANLAIEGVLLVELLSTHPRAWYSCLKMSLTSLPLKEITSYLDFSSLVSLAASTSSLAHLQPKEQLVKGKDFSVYGLREDLISKSTLSFGHCPN